MNQENDILNLINKPKTLRKGFDLLVKTYSKQLYFQIQAVTTNHEDTDDILQNTFIKVWKNITTFKGNSKLSTWLYIIAKNETYSFLKKKNKFRNSSEKLTVNIFASLKAETNVDSDIVLEKLNAAVDLLPKKQKEVFKLRYFQEMKYAEMATKLNLSESALKSSYHFAVKKIEAFLKQD